MAKTKRASNAKSEQGKNSASSARKRQKQKDESTSSDDEKKPSKPQPKSKSTAQCITERDVLKKLWDPSEAEKKGSTSKFETEQPECSFGCRVLSEGLNVFVIACNIPYPSVQKSSLTAFKIVSWNVDGLRAVLKNTPDALSKLVTTHNIDVLCLQETKLQESHLDDPKLNNLRHVLDSKGYDAYWSCSTAKKGYSGTAVFVKRRGAASNSKRKTINTFFQSKSSKTSAKAEKAVGDDNYEAIALQNVSYGMGKPEHDAEGRMITVDFAGLSLATVYVPNSGQKLERLDYRTKQWDKDLLTFMQKRQAERGVPVMWLGDLNVAHGALDVYNEGAKHLSKQAGTTPEERASFQEQVDAGYVDAFRKFHPEAKGHYSYWSVRAGNRLTNKGLRLDYFVCSPSLFEDDAKIIARDCYMLHEQQGSDHCPIILELEIKK
jgi:exodeoxyribonuclease-3